jgi:hypothetical protein
MRKLRHAVTSRGEAPGQSAPFGEQAPCLLQITHQRLTTRLFAAVLIAARSENNAVRFCSEGRSHST